MANENEKLRELLEEQKANGSSMSVNEARAISDTTNPTTVNPEERAYPELSPIGTTAPTNAGDGTDSAMYRYREQHGTLRNQQDVENWNNRSNWPNANVKLNKGEAKEGARRFDEETAKKVANKEIQPPIDVQPYNPEIKPDEVPDRATAESTANVSPPDMKSVSTSEEIQARGSGEGATQETAEDNTEQGEGASGVYAPTGPTNDVDTSTKLRFETPVATPKATRKRRWTDAFFERKQPGETDNEAQARRERNSKRIAAIGDLARAMANQYYTRKGGLNTYDVDNTLFGNVDKYQKDMEERRRKNEDSYFSRYLKQREADRKEYKDRADEEIKRAQLAIKEAQADQQAELNDLRIKAAQEHWTQEQLKTEEERAKAKYADRIQQENLAILMARQGYWNAATGAQNSLANERDTRAAHVGESRSGSSSGGSSSGGSGGSGSSSGGSSKKSKGKSEKIGVWGGSASAGASGDADWNGFQG